MPPLIFLTSGSCRHLIACCRSTWAISLSDGELQGVVLVFTDQVKQPSVHVDVTARVREGVDLVLPDSKFIGDLLAIELREERLGGLFHTLSPWPVGRDRIELNDHVVELVRPVAAHRLC